MNSDLLDSLCANDWNEKTQRPTISSPGGNISQYFDVNYSGIIRFSSNWTNDYKLDEIAFREMWFGIDSRS